MVASNAATAKHLIMADDIYNFVLGILLVAFIAVAMISRVRLWEHVGNGVRRGLDGQARRRKRPRSLRKPGW
jgi:hypothetical protein